MRERERKRGGRGKTGCPSFAPMFLTSSSPHADNGVICRTELWRGEPVRRREEEEEEEKWECREAAFA